MAGRGKTEVAVLALLEREGTDMGRYVDLGVVWQRPDGTELVAVGGRFDTREQEYVADAREAVTIRLIADQLQPAMDAVEWLTANIAYREAIAKELPRPAAHAHAWGTEYEPLYRLHLFGGRRGGKSRLAIEILILAAVAIPGMRAVVVSPSKSRTGEINTAIRAAVPVAWARYQQIEGEVKGFVLANGSRIELHTAHAGELKIGPVDIALVNEAQEIGHQPVLDIRGCLIDMGGLCVYAYNPPRTKKGVWVREEWLKVDKGDDKNASAYHFDPRKNPHIDHVALKSNNFEPQAYKREILGKMNVPLEKVVFPYFDSDVHVIPAIPPSWHDITTEVARHWYGEAAPWIGGLDFDKGAGCAWVLIKFFVEVAGDDIATAWPVLINGRRESDFQEWQLDQRLLLAPDQYGRSAFGGNRKAVIWTADASASWQNSERKSDKPTSWQQLTGKGWRICPPDPVSKGNPRLTNRFGCARRLIFEGRFNVLEGAKELVDAIRDYPTMKDTEEPMRRHKLAHLNDAWTYPIYRRYAERPGEQDSKGGQMPHARALKRRGKPM